MIALFTNPFLQLALVAGVAASVTSGIVGSYIVVKRILFLSGSIAHCVLGGMGLCLWLRRTMGLLWLTPLHGAFAAALASAFLIGWIHLKYREREDTVIAMLWSTGMALGVVFVALTPGYNVELMNFLFGNLLWVSWTEIYALVAVDLIVVLTVRVFYHRFLALCFDEEQAMLQGIPVQRLYFLLLALVALSVVLLVQVVGIILVIAMLTLPAAIASTHSHRLSSMMWLAVLLGGLFTLLGLIVAYECNWPAGASISLVAAAAYCLNLILPRRLR